MSIKFGPAQVGGLQPGLLINPLHEGVREEGMQRVRYKLQGNDSIAASMPKYLHNEFIKINDLSQGRPSFPSCT